MAKMQLPRNEPARLVAIDILEGYYDEDLRILRDLCNRRMRQQIVDEQASRTVEYEVGDLVEYVGSASDAWHPKYVLGATLIITNRVSWRGRGPERPAHVRYEAEIVSLKHKPRGGPPRVAGKPGAPARYVIGASIGVNPPSIRKVNTSAITNEYKTIQRRLKGEQ